MADPIADNAQLAVDELKRKARRRLIGAIVLALAAATLLPLLLEQDPKTLGDDVSVQIPPVDGSKFVTRLTGDKGKEPAPAPRADAKVEPKAETKAEPKAETKAETKPENAAPQPDTKAKAEAEAKPEPAVKAAPAPQPPAAGPAASPSGAATLSGGSPAGSPAPADATASTPGTGIAGSDVAKVEGFIVQLGAFTDSYGANALARRLKAVGYPAYTESIETGRGKLWRVRVGGYPTRALANEARDKLKADGQNGVVSAVK